MLVANRDTRVRIDQWESTVGGADAVTEGRKRKKDGHLGKGNPSVVNGLFPQWPFLFSFVDISGTF
jgi:hypothetical protein